MTAAIQRFIRATTATLGGRWPKAIRPLALVLLLSGPALAVYVGHEYWSMHSAQQRLAAEWQQQNLAHPYSSSLEDQVTRVVIPKIQLDVLMTEGTSRKALIAGPGHVENTAVPGALGNAAIAGHRDTFFRHLNDLSEGDDIFVRRSGHEYHYVVTRKKVVGPRDISVLAPSTDRRLTLITCYPIYYIGPAPRRLVVTAEGVSGAVAENSN